MMRARVFSPVVIAERLSSQHWVPRVSGSRGSVIMLAVTGAAVSVYITGWVTGGWNTGILLLARPMVSIDITSRVDDGRLTTIVLPPRTMVAVDVISMSVGGWGADILLSSRPTVSVDVISRAVVKRRTAKVL